MSTTGTKISKGQKLKNLWIHRSEIWEGWYNYWRGKPEIREMADRRIAICRTNKCGNYDPRGTSEASYIRGFEACGICGCIFPALQSVPESECSMVDINETPLWTSETIK